MTQEEKLKYLFERYLSRQATDEEYDQLLHALENQEMTEDWKAVISRMMSLQPEDADYDEGYWETMIDKILREGKLNTGRPERNRRMIRWISVAAIAIALLGIGVWFTLQSQTAKPSVATLQKDQPESAIHPGGNKAILTLANGQKIVLDSTRNGLLSMQGNTKIVLTGKSRLAYTGHHAKNGKRQILYNTVATPRGGKFQVVLPDGSKVWLNAASSIRFPTEFAGKERRVEITGEVYFEVAANPSLPFVVQLPSSGEINVLGTAFNVNAYKDENVINTTLAGGAVKVKISDNKPVLLKPGQQAQWNRKSNEMQVRQADLDKILAWKNDLFYFDNTNIREIMRQLARWYDVDVIYDTKNLEQKNFSGIVSRYNDIEPLLKRMELTGTIHFKIEGRKIKVAE